MNYILTYDFTYEADGDCFEYDNYEYNPSKEEIDEAWEQFLEELNEPIELLDSVEELREYYEDQFTDFLTEWCRDAAKDAFNDDPKVCEYVNEAIEYRRDPYAYYGVSRSDFC